MTATGGLEASTGQQLMMLRPLVLVVLLILAGAPLGRHTRTVLNHLKHPWIPLGTN